MLASTQTSTFEKEQEKTIQTNTKELADQLEKNQEQVPMDITNEEPKNSESEIKAEKLTEEEMQI